MRVLTTIFGAICALTVTLTVASADAQTLVAKLNASDPADLDQFGRSVAFDGNTLVDLSSDPPEVFGDSRLPDSRQRTACKPTNPHLVRLTVVANTAAIDKFAR